jgi:hypothetical protein
MKTETPHLLCVDERQPAEVPSRYVVDPISGFEYVRARPDQRLVTSEEIYEQLKDFP